MVFMLGYCVKSYTKTPGLFFLIHHKQKLLYLVNIFCPRRPHIERHVNGYTHKTPNFIYACLV